MVLLQYPPLCQEGKWRGYNLSPRGQKSIKRALDDAESALHTSDLKQRRSAPTKEEITQIRSALRALTQAVREIVNDNNT